VTSPSPRRARLSVRAIVEAAIVIAAITSACAAPAAIAAPSATDSAASAPPATSLAPTSTRQAPPAESTPSVTGLPFTPPIGCTATRVDAASWRLRCGDDRDRDARGTVVPALLRQGWHACGFGLASARFARDAFVVAIAEGSGVAGEGFIVTVRPIGADCNAVAPPSLEISATAFVGARLGWIGTGFGRTAALFATSDGGMTWTRLDVPEEISRVTELRFVDARHGWMLAFANRGITSVGCNAAAPPGASPCRDILFRTSDGGRSWKALHSRSIYPDGGPSLRDAQFVDANAGWILERRALDPCRSAARCYTLLRTVDGGDTWQAVFGSMLLADIRFVDRLHGWGLLPRENTVDVTATADGGDTWHQQIAGEQILRLAVPSVGVAIALSRDGAYCTASYCSRYGLFRINDGRFETVHDTDGRGWWPARPDCGGFLDAMFFVDAHVGWIGLSRGVGGASGFNPAGLIATRDGGASWSCVEAFADRDVVDVWFADRAHGWAVSRSHEPTSTPGRMDLWRTDDGGVTWRQALA
jgi:photosystem II stability/assembly factor-like uncharacterized protein